ncbi:hypothetical protein [Streptomyces colonosanans]|uniref:Uncharacterized protein n=1 Tax=Streptomyces colonosanans TaxID=1428652 RepID=A0A1S2P139_9ACTN|nr:hypothetical protein [Streptomyces colonosanans]OIJ87135.1 hypothetical protein BIV24_25190 [Streptomyces colonosanans]
MIGRCQTRTSSWTEEWVKTCCDRCYFVPRNLTNDEQYRYLVEESEPEPDPDGCRVANEGLALAMCTQFDQGGLPTLQAKLEELRESMWWRSPHYDVFSGHAVVLAVEQACEPDPVR